MNIAFYQSNGFAQLKSFLETAPLEWPFHLEMKQCLLPTGEIISCIFRNNSFYITGTDIIKILIYRFIALGRPIQDLKKFQEGAFSDFRNLKLGIDAALESANSPFLQYLYHHKCIKTQKRQKVFYWFAVNHDKLFIDALERDLKKEALGQPSCTIDLEQRDANQVLELAKKNVIELKSLPIVNTHHSIPTTPSHSLSHHMHSIQPGVRLPMVSVDSILQNNSQSMNLLIPTKSPTNGKDEKRIYQCSFPGCGKFLLHFFNI